jgi:hypothetical protein
MVEPLVTTAKAASISTPATPPPPPPQQHQHDLKLCDDVRVVRKGEGMMKYI